MLKKNSKLALKGSWGRAILLLLITMGVSVLVPTLRQIATSVFVPAPVFSNPTMEPPFSGDFFNAFVETFRISWVEWVIIVVSGILSLLLSVPLSLGVVRWFYNIVHGRSLPITEAFHFFETGRTLWRAIWYEINVSIRCGLWAILFYCVPSSILGVSIYYLSGNGEPDRSAAAVATTGIFLSVVLFLLATIFYAACICRYALAPYLLSESDDVTVKSAIRSSIAYTKGYRFSLMWFSLSFIGWFLLLIPALPVVFYVFPYCNTAVAMYSRYIIEKNRYSEPDSTKEFSSLPENSAEDAKTGEQADND